MPCGTKKPKFGKGLPVTNQQVKSNLNATLGKFGAAKRSFLGKR